MDRRDFIKTLPLAAGLPAVMGFRGINYLLMADEDAIICAKKFAFSASENLHSKPINEVIIAIGKSFIGTEYMANTLEQPGPEHLVINMRGLDCVTFCENSLALSRCIKQGKTTFENFKANIQFIRYRGGIINGYPSRLHYFSDYIYDGVKKAVFNNVTESIGGVKYIKTVDFMSTHPEDYRQLKENKEFAGVIKKQEDAINQRTMFHIPKEDIEKAADKIKDGDILAITTGIKGMDVSHTGVAIWQNSRLHFMHAPNVGYKVQITENPLSEYLAGHKLQFGIMVARPLEVKG